MLHEQVVAPQAAEKTFALQVTVAVQVEESPATGSDVEEPQGVQTSPAHSVDVCDEGGTGSLPAHAPLSIAKERTNKRIRSNRR
jgi:hypothetical protein